MNGLLQSPRDGDSGQGRHTERRGLEPPPREGRGSGGWANHHRPMIWPRCLRGPPQTLHWEALRGEAERCREAALWGRQRRSVLPTLLQGSPPPAVPDLYPLIKNRKSSGCFPEFCEPLCKVIKPRSRNLWPVGNTADDLNLGLPSQGVADPWPCGVCTNHRQVALELSRRTPSRGLLGSWVEKPVHLLSEASGNAEERRFTVWLSRDN